MKPLPRWEGHKLHSLMPLLFRKRTVMAAWEKVRKNKGAPGVDGETVEEFEKDLKRRTMAIGEDLRLFRWQPKPLRRVLIPKPDGRKRGLSIPCIEDRVVHGALAIVLYPVFEDRFGPECFAYMNGRSALDAIERVRNGIRAGKAWVVETDVQKFYYTMDRKRMLGKLAERIADGTFLRTVSKVIHSGVLGEMEDGAAKDIGVPQGSPLSPVLANIYLANFDREVGSRWMLTRYSDDLVVQCDTKEEAEAALAAIEEALRKEGLEIKKEKTRVVHAREGFDFLGYHITEQGLRPTKKALKSLKEKVRAVTRRHDTRPLKEMVPREMRIVNGWTNYYRLVEPSVLWPLGGWLLTRTRTRMKKRGTRYRKWNVPMQEVYDAGLRLPYHILTDYHPQRLGKPYE